MKSFMYLSLVEVGYFPSEMSLKLKAPIKFSAFYVIMCIVNFTLS